MDKKCSKCGLIKPLNEYHKNYDNLRNECKTCGNARRKEWHNQNTSKWRNLVYKDTYGISLGEYNLLHNAQRGLCAICKREEKAKRNGICLNLAIDHDHLTGKVRGLLCCSCNNGLGRFKDSIDIIKEAMLYLQKSQK